ncbi:UNVERIFIED_CONTAM: hypothetical protein Slati_0914300 [Sesamum latifolium]|uniref:Uncharacterized protein n=1 Tax=Sesamum latifolium TaxID=2727402 RepID=A0AAW2XPU0_9LAMI
MKIKFPTPGGVGEVQGDPLQSRRCYVDTVHKGQKKNGGDAPDKAPPSKKGRTPEGENSEETETPARFNRQKNCSTSRSYQEFLIRLRELALT